jgi:hypothetical protein
VSFASNGRGGEQLAMVAGDQLKIFDLQTNVLSAAIVLPLTNAPRQVEYIDGYFLLTETDSIRTYFSAIFDGTTWDALDFFARSHTSDNVIGTKVLRDKIWVFGSLTSEVYYDSGDADNPFVPYPGSVMHEGAVSQWAIGVQGESVIWLSQDTEGNGRISRAADYSPQPVSTYAIGYALASYATLTDFEILIYEQENHPFAVFSSTSADATWCFDAREGQWHQRSTRDAATGVDKRWRARGCCSVGSTIVVGDMTNGNLYTLDLDCFTDNAGMMVAERTAPYLSSENQWLFLDQIELGMQSGVGLNLSTAQGYDPEVLLAISRDSGHTWTNTVTTKMGKLGDYGARAVWRHLGRARSDRLAIRVRITDPVRRVLGPGLWLRVTPGSGAL